MLRMNGILLLFIILSVSEVQQDIYGHHDRVDTIEYNHQVVIEQNLMQYTGEIAGQYDE
jgi:hypothetical protein